MSIIHDTMKPTRQYKTTSSGPLTREVDLHLRPGYTGHDAIDRQLARFRGELDSALKTGLREVIFVHGQGSGKLRDEIRHLIAREYPDCICSDASFARYGYGGATLVTLKKQ